MCERGEKEETRTAKRGLVKKQSPLSDAVTLKGGTVYKRKERSVKRRSYEKVLWNKQNSDFQVI